MKPYFLGRIQQIICLHKYYLRNVNLNRTFYSSNNNGLLIRKQDDISKSCKSQLILNKFPLIHTSSLRAQSLITDEASYDQISEATLESLYECIEELLEQDGVPQDSDITMASGVLTLKLGSHGTYVINKQSPNQQIWLSSPISGPKRFDFVNNSWIYKHDGCLLHHLLNDEFKTIFSHSKTIVDLFSCEYSGN